MPRRQHAVAMLGSSFFTSDSGVIKITSPTADYTLSGMPRALDLVLTLSSAGTPVLLPTGSQVAYRVCWGIRDANNNLVIGAASGRFLINNASGSTRDVTVQFQVPPEITTAHIYQIYRTAQITNTSDPGDEEGLVYEGNPTSSQITTTLISVLDTVPDIFRSTPLHSNATRDGAGQTNDRPPYCRDISRQYDMLLFANTKLLQTYEIQMLGVANLTAATSTITIAGVTYTAQTTETVASGFFQKFTTGTDSLNTENTAKSLVKVINQFTANTQVWAYYASGPTDPPGFIVLQARSYAVPAFFVTVNSAATGNAFNPTPPTANSDQVKSSDDNRPNRVYFSKLGEPEAVPNGENYLDCGGADEEIQRCIQLRDWNCVIKDKSIWKLTGSSPSELLIAPLDNTVAIVGRDTAVTLNNQVVCLTNQGVVAISDSGVSIISRQIEADLLADVRASVALGNSDAWVAVAHESDRCYRLWGPTYVYGDSAGATICWKYNTITRAWTRELTNASCGAVLNDRVIYGLNNAFGFVLQQRMGYADANGSVGSIIESADPEGTVVLSAVSGVTATFAFTDSVNWAGYYSGFGPGFAVLSGCTWYIVDSVNGTTVTFDRPGVTAGSKTCYRGIPTDVEFCPRTTSQNFSEKQLTDLQISAICQNVYKVNVTFTNETDTKADQFNDTYTSSPPSFDIVVGDAIGSDAPVVPLRRIRTEVLRARSRGAQIGVRIKHNVALTRFAIQSVGIETRRTDEAKATR